MLLPILAAVLAAVVLVAIVSLLVRGRSRTSRETSPPARASAPTPTAPTVAARGAGRGSKVRALFSGQAPSEDEWGGLEELLIGRRGPVTASRIVGDLRERYEPGDDPATMVADEVVDVLSGDDTALHLPGDRLGVVMVVGVNGSGKTTTIGKLAARLARDGKKVSLAGSDTFRAAASEQLDVWARRAGAQMIAQERGADSWSLTR
jgi:fused signal recognition particle receptor